MIGQSRLMSAVEAVANVLVGYGVAVATQAVVFPWFGLYVPLETNLAIGAVFTVVSLVRSFAVRRLFNRIHAGPSPHRDRADGAWWTGFYVGVGGGAFAVFFGSLAWAFR